MTRFVVLLLAGCGRLAFDPLTADDADPSRDAPPGACPSFAIVCDDFESGGRAQWPGEDINPGGAIAVASGVAHSPIHALAATMTPAGGNGAAAVVIDLPAFTSGTMALRFWARTDRQLNGNGGIGLIYDPLANRYLNIGADGNAVWTVHESTTISVSDHIGSGTPAVDQWICVELDFTFLAPGAPGRIELFANDMRVVDTPATEPAPAYSRFEIGITRSPGNGFGLFVDDVVIARQHIGC